MKLSKRGAGNKTEKISKALHNIKQSNDKNSNNHRDKNKLILMPLIVVILAAVSFIAYSATRHKEPYEWIVEVGGKKLYVEIADTDEEQTKGLSGRQNMSANHGMLFTFPDEAQHAFWMKDALLPLDLIYFDKDMKATDIKGSFQPCTSGVCLAFIPRHKALYVLEVNAGFASKYRIKEGAELKIVKKLGQKTEKSAENAPEEEQKTGGLQEIQISDSLKLN